MQNIVQTFRNFILQNDFEYNLNHNKQHEIIENNYIIELHNQTIMYRKKYDHQEKLLIIIATHITDHNKFDTLKNNIQYFLQHDVIIVNSANLPLQNDVQQFCQLFNIQYFEVENDIYLDFGKWNNVLSQIIYDSYDYVVFTNDSIYLTSSIDHFFNLMVTRNVELYGYNDSSEINYHYQSYLFGVKKTSIEKFKIFFQENKKYIHTVHDLIENTELKLANTFVSKDCFLHIIDFKSCQTINIHFRNDNLYKKLLLNNILPIIKLKRILT